MNENKVCEGWLDCTYSVIQPGTQMRGVIEESECVRGVREGERRWWVIQYLGGLVEQGAQQKLIVLCVLKPDVSMLHFILPRFLSSQFSG